MKNILVVDDDPLVRQVLCFFLSSEGVRAIAASDGKEALEVVREGAETIDLLLIDFMMPGMNGRALARAVLSRLPGAKIFFMSGFPVSEADLENTLERKIRFFRKPIDLEALVKAVRDEMGALPA